MKTVSTLPEFAQLSELEVQSALDAYDALPEPEGEGAFDAVPENPIVREFFRLVNAYSQRLDEMMASSKNSDSDPEKFLEEIFDYEPPTVIEREAFDFFSSVCEDALRDMDDGDDADGGR